MDSGEGLYGKAQKWNELTRERDKAIIALFLSYKHCRMSVNAIERCVKKYTQVVTGTDDYSCHKLRDTFGTRIYAETGGNAKKVQVALNHKSASTTLDYYIAAIDGIEKEATFTETEINGL